MGAMWREVSSGYCCHGEKICRKISTENVSRLLLEPEARCFWRKLTNDKDSFLNVNVQERNFENVSKTYFCDVFFYFYFCMKFLLTAFPYFYKY